jgi:tetratricopeptide (TPR) repeat protein
MAKHGLRAPLELTFALGLLLAVWAAHTSNRQLEGFEHEAVETGDVGALPNGKVLRVASLGFERLVADLYWIRSVFYVGSDAAREANYPGAEPLAQLITDIDPDFASAYVLLGSVLGSLRYDVDAAIRLLEKGARNTTHWRIRFMLGFQYFMEKGDYRKGAEHLQAAYDLGGPTYLPLLVSRLYAHGGDLDTSILFLRERLKQERFPKVKRKLERRLRDALIQRDLEHLQAAIERHASERGAAPANVAALAAAGYWSGPTTDPLGKPYRIEDGRAVSDTPFEVLKIKE